MAGPLDDFSDDATLNSYLILEEEDEPEEQKGLLDQLNKLWNKS